MMGWLLEALRHSNWSPVLILSVFQRLLKSFDLKVSGFLETWTGPTWKHVSMQLYFNFWI
jgi:hypothetical protein